MKQTTGRRCTICNHPARPRIDLAIATGLSKRAVAERFEVSRDAVWRHAQAHLTAEMRAALATKLLQREGDTRRILLEEGAGVTEALKAIRGPLFGLFLAAVDTGDHKAAAALSGRLHENLALVAKLTGELVPHAGTSTWRLISLSISLMRSIPSRLWRIGSNLSPTLGRHASSARARHGSCSIAAGNPASQRRRPPSRSTPRFTIPV